MDFPQAMSEVLNNMKIRRNEWPDGVYVMIKDESLIIHNETGDHSWLIQKVDLYAEDFMVTI